MARPPKRRALRPTKTSRKRLLLVKPTTYFFPFLISFIALFLILVTIGSLYLHRKMSLLSFEVSIPNLEEKSINNRPVHIKISSASIDAPIKTVKVSSDSWPTYEDAVSYISNSGQPMENGNMIMYSLPQPSLFGRLSQVRVGDIIIITTWDEKPHEYLVQDSLVVGATETKTLLDTKHGLTLLTSSGFFNSKRLVIWATPIKLPTF